MPPRHLVPYVLTHSEVLQLRETAPRRARTPRATPIARADAAITFTQTIGSHQHILDFRASKSFRTRSTIPYPVHRTFGGFSYRNSSTKSPLEILLSHFLWALGPRVTPRSTMPFRDPRPLLIGPFEHRSSTDNPPSRSETRHFPSFNADLSPGRRPEDRRERAPEEGLNGAAGIIRASAGWARHHRRESRFRGHPASIITGMEASLHYGNSTSGPVRNKKSSNH